MLTVLGYTSQRRLLIRRNTVSKNTYRVLTVLEDCVLQSLQIGKG